MEKGQGIFSLLPSPFSPSPQPLPEQLDEVGVAKGTLQRPNTDGAKIEGTAGVRRADTRDMFPGRGADDPAEDYEVAGAEYERQERKRGSGRATQAGHRNAARYGAGHDRDQKADDDDRVHGGGGQQSPAGQLA